LFDILRDTAKQISKEERDKYWRRSEIYRHWLLDNIFKAGDEDCVTIMILPIEQGQPNYRDVEPPYVLRSHPSTTTTDQVHQAPWYIAWI
jgi:hypothetical protein